MNKNIRIIEDEKKCQFSLLHKILSHLIDQTAHYLWYQKRICNIRNTSEQIIIFFKINCASKLKLEFKMLRLR